MTIASAPGSLAYAKEADELLTDENLMKMIEARSHCALSLLRDRYGGILKSVGMKVLHNDADAEDLLQEVLLEIWNRVGKYDPEKGRPLSWLATMAHRRSIDKLRKRETRVEFEDRFAEEARHNGESWTHIHEQIAQRELSEHLRHALATLPAAQRAAIELAYHGEMTQREISAHTGIPLGTIKTRLELGLSKMAVALRGLRALLEREPSKAKHKQLILQPVLPGAR